MGAALNDHEVLDKMSTDTEKWPFSLKKTKPQDSTAPMLTPRSSPTAPLDNEERRVQARHRRREAAAPYPLSTRGKGDDEEGDDEESTAPVRRGGFFARLASYIPIVNMLIKEEEVEDIQTSQREEEGEVISCAEKMETRQFSKAVEVEQTLGDETMLDVPVSQESREFKNKKESPKRSSPSPRTGDEVNARGSAMMPSQLKCGDKRVVFPRLSQPKMLHIVNTQGQGKSSSPSPHDTALAVTKKRKTISLDEFERLKHRLHEVVETTPQAQLAMTQAALANGLEHPFTRGFPGPTSFPGYVPGSIANQNHGALVNQDEKKRGGEDEMRNGVPFGKRPRRRENGPILFSKTFLRGQLTREDRLKRKPRPSRFLTGAKGDISVRNAYSAAVTEKILSTLRNIQTPLEREEQKPTPSTSMLWAKYHLPLVNNQAKSFENGGEIHSDDVPPPTTTIPRVVFPQPSKKAAALSFSSPSKTAFDTPSKITKAVSNSVTSMFSPQAVSMTPALTAKTSTPEQLQFQTTGEFTFTLPLFVEGMKPACADDVDTRVRFEFSPPSSMREPPVKVFKRKTARKVDSSAAPYDYIPSSPKMKATKWVSKPPTAKEREKPKVDAQKPVTAETADKAGSGSGSMAPTPAGAVNPLARFMQLKPGQWKCPGCSVLNEATSAKCPCCETAKPGGRATEKASSEAPKVSDKNLSSDFNFDVAAVNAKKNTAKPAAGLITEGGFSFGAPCVDSKNITERPATSISSSGFNFGAPAADATKDADKFAVEITSGGFSYTAPAVSSKNPAIGDLIFGATATSFARTDAIASTALISSGFAAPVKKVDDALTKMSTVTGKGASAPSFSFGVSAPSTSTPVQLSAVTNSAGVSSGFTFGGTSANPTDGTNKGKRKAPEAEVSTNDSAPSFSFGATTHASTVPGFSFGVATETKLASPEESDRPMKRLAGSKAASDLKQDASIFSFGTTSTPATKSTETPSLTSSFNFGGSSSSTTQNLKETTTPAFSFNTTSTGMTSVSTEAKFKEILPSKTGFTFGSSSTTEPKSSTGFGQNTESQALFSFGPSASTSTPTSSAQATSTPAASSVGFTFGQNTTHATSSAPVFGAATSAPAFGFGAPTPPRSATSTLPMALPPSPAASMPAFTFGSSSTKPAGSSTFGQVPASTSNFGSTSTAFGSNSSTVYGSGSSAGGFGSTSTATPATKFGNAASPAIAAPAFSIEASSHGPSPAATAAQPVFSFGASSGYGAAPAVLNGFGPSGPSGGFGAAPGGFTSSSSAPAFGNQSAPACSSNRPPLTSTFGGPAFGAPGYSGLSSGLPSSGFRTPSPTPAFGAAQAAPAFGAAPNMVFGATAPAAAVFGASTDGGFNMGAAPQHVKGRRILKAKSRNRRIS